MYKLTKINFIKFIQEKAGYFGITGVTATSTTVIVAFYLYTSVDPTFNTISNCVSDLGTGPNMSNIIYNIGAVITGLCQISLYSGLIKYLQNENGNPYLIKITRLTFMISAIGLIILGIIPFERGIQFFYFGHGSAAAIHYVTASIAFICYGIFELLILKFSKILGVISFLTGIIYSSLWVGYLIDYTVKLPKVYMNYSLQWISLAGILFWSLVHSIFLILTKKRNSENA